MVQMKSQTPAIIVVRTNLNTFLAYHYCIHNDSQNLRNVTKKRISNVLIILSALKFSFYVMVYWTAWMVQMKDSSAVCYN